MIKSMTGYGKGDVTDELGRCVVEIKSVNNRYGELSARPASGCIACSVFEVEKLFEHEAARNAGRMPALSH